MIEPMHLLSLGAGVQSSTLALMAAHGEITPMPAAAIFADTQAEPDSVYRWLEWLETQLPFPVHRVTTGNIAVEALALHKHRTVPNRVWSSTLVPAFTLAPDGTKGMSSRFCTSKYKIEPLMKAYRKIAGITRGQKTVGVVSWIGISLDEVQRMKPARLPWVENRWPLIEQRLTRADCLRWMAARGYPTPPRSACVFCPYRNDAQWRQMRDEEPEEFATAVQFERMYQDTKRQTTMDCTPYLHRSLVPLDRVKFAADTQTSLNWSSFTEECEGMCGV